MTTSSKKMEEKGYRKVLSGYTKKPAASESYTDAIGTALGEKNTRNGVGILLGGRRRMIGEWQAKAYADFKAKGNKLGRYTNPNKENLKRKYDERQAAVCDKLKLKLEERRLAAKAQTKGDITIQRADGSVD